MKIDRTILPQEFRYNQETKVLEVEYVNGSITKFFEIDSRCAFLDKTNERRNYDWFEFLNFRCNHNPFFCDGHNFICDCPSNLKSEVIQEATEELNRPQTRPLLASQQNHQ